MQHICTNKNSQQGATLIVVLLLLILIVLAGAIAVRKSSTDLRLATASQVDALLFISAEQPNATLEQMSKDPNTSLASATSPIGYFIDNPAVENNELLFCFRPKEVNPLSYFNAAELKDDRTRLNRSNANAYCNAKKSNDYTSERNATMVQTSFTTGAIGTGTPLLPMGVDLHGGGARSYSINVDSVSSIPSYGSADDDTVTDCFEKPLTKPATSTEQTVSECLDNAGIPNKAVTQNYLVQYTEKEPVSSTTLTP